MQQDQRWPNAQAVWTKAAEKSPYVCLALVKSYDAQESLASAHQPIGSMRFQTEKSATANREGSLFPRTINSEN
jgi:hypothetical protein